MPRSLATRILLLALGVGAAADVMLPGNAPGIDAFLLVAGVLGAALASAGRAGLRRMDPADAWLAPAALLFAGLVAVRADPWLVQADVMCALALGAGSVASLGGQRVTRGLVPDLLALAIGILVAATIGAVEVLAAIRRRPEGGDVEARRRRPHLPGGLVPVLRGLAIASPVLLLFGLLFASADAVFASTARSLLDWHLDLGGALDRSAVIAVIAWFVAGLLLLATGGAADTLAGLRGPGDGTAPTRPGWRTPEPRSLGAASAAAMRDAAPLGTVEATTVLAALDLLFGIFVALQVAYLFGGRDTLAAAGMTYAEYARRGFFELVAVAALAGGLVVAIDLVVGRRSRAQLVAALVLLGLTAVILASALLRLRLYQDAYGWTELRFVVLSSIGWLAIALAGAGVLLATRRTRWTLHMLGILTLVTVLAMNVVGPGATVASENLRRAVDASLVPAGGRTGLDAAYLAALGDEAVPATVAAWDHLPAASRVPVEAFLADRARALERDPSLSGWPSWNLAREHARDALTGWQPAAP